MTGCHIKREIKSRGRLLHKTLLLLTENAIKDHNHIVCNKNSMVCWLPVSYSQTSCIATNPILNCIVPPRKLLSKNPKVALNLWQKLRKSLGKVVPKLRAILHIFGCKTLLWPLVLWQILAMNKKTT